MDKVLLRDMLFQKYFEIEDGVSVKDLNDKLSFIPEVWGNLRALCEKNMRRFDRFSSLEKIKMIEHNQKKYLILKLRMCRYLIIDLDRMVSISREEFQNEFNEEFFISNFGETSVGDDCFDFFYLLDKYQGDVQELLDFYMENIDVLNLSSRLYCKLDEQDAWTWLFIDYANASSQLGFQTPDQTLYEQLFLNYDLTPFGMQDAINKMGIDKMREIFSKVSDIKIPKECIPADLYEQYLLNSNQMKLVQK